MDEHVDLADEIEAALRKGGSSIERVETHISWVFLGPERVLKVKKPVAFGFLDFSSATARREACIAELAVNARFAPDVYRGLVAIVRRADGTIAFADPDDVGGASIVEYAVSMTRLPDVDRADVRLGEGRLGKDEIDRVADRIAVLHAESARGPEIDRFATAEAIGKNVTENFSAIAGKREEAVPAHVAEAVEAWQTAFLRDESARFGRRIEGGFVRDGHGDLRLEHVYLRPEDVRVLDAIEFSPALRAGDVAADVAFLSMELVSRGHVELGERFLARYARAANDFDLYTVVDFYEAYRACVRGKIALLRASEGDADARERAIEEARRMFLVALSCGRGALLRPAVVAVGGLIASGTSTLADALGAAMSAPVVDADRTRKDLVAVAATTPLHHGAWDGAYALDFTERVYTEVLRRARVVVASGRPVVIDASFRSRVMRERARELAHTCGVPFHFVECVVPTDVAKARLAKREQSASVSDGRRAIFDDFARSWEAVRELSAEEHVVVDGRTDIAAIVASLGERLPIWPEGLNG